MLRLLRPVPGKPMEALTPVPRVFKVSWKGPTLMVLVNDLMPFSVMLKPAMTLSKLKADLGLVMIEVKKRRV